jgi:hypothetical protein
MPGDGARGGLRVTCCGMEKSSNASCELTLNTAFPFKFYDTRANFIPVHGLLKHSECLCIDESSIRRSVSMDFGEELTLVLSFHLGID